MKLYTVKCSSGSWDSYHQWIDSIYDSEVLANQRILDLQKEYDEKMSKNPFPDMEIFDICDLSEEEQEKYYDWKATFQNTSEEYNGAKIVEYELNEVPKIND